MDISLNTIQDLAPDQASLNAANKLLKPAKWPLKGQASDIHCIWGQCQGSGANPYFTMANLQDHGYKCTCPSRKFPCKHVLALMWQYAEGAADFNESAPPEWVNDWLSRRRKAGNQPDTGEQPKTKKNIQTTGEDQAKPLSPEEQAKKDAAKAKRAAQTKAKTQADISAGLTECQQWINDQLRTGLAPFIDEARERCRRIAARLVDAKATSLASRLDELPAKLMELPNEQQLDVAIQELGKIVLLCQAWFSNQEDHDARSAIATVENREQVLSHQDVLRCQGVWETVGEKTSTRRDGLISHATWLLKIDDPAPTFALLLDYYPASVGRRELVPAIGHQIEGNLAFYPSRCPLRAFIVEHKVVTAESTGAWPLSQQDLYLGYQQHLASVPWAEWYPHLLPAGRILRDKKNHYWWQSQDGEQAVPLSNPQVPPLLLGCELQACFIVWDGHWAELFSAHSQQWGTLAC